MGFLELKFFKNKKTGDTKNARAELYLVWNFDKILFIWQ